MRAKVVWLVQERHASPSMSPRSNFPSFELSFSSISPRAEARAAGGAISKLAGMDRMTSFVPMSPVATAPRSPLTVAVEGQSTLSNFAPLAFSHSFRASGADMFPQRRAGRSQTDFFFLSSNLRRQSDSAEEFASRAASPPASSSDWLIGRK